MKKYLIITVIILLGVIFAEYQQVKYANGKWETAEANVKAYAAQASDAEGKNVALQLTVDPLCYFKDFVLQELDSTRKQLKGYRQVQLRESSFAEREGFEPPVPLGTTVFKTVVIDHSTISPVFEHLESRCKGTK